MVDLGGGIGVPEQLGHGDIDLGSWTAESPNWREVFRTSNFGWNPAGFWSRKAGVLVAVVTQLKGKGDVHYVGIATGMNSLIRPALYGAHHDIRNLTRLDDPLSHRVNVVGPICETADQLGADRWLPRPKRETYFSSRPAGPTVMSMASNYNLRPPAAEFVL